jgi:hypothetical protein
LFFSFCDSIAAHFKHAATAMYIQCTTSGAAGNGLYTTIKYMRGAAGIGLSTTIKYLVNKTRARATGQQLGQGPHTKKLPP